MTGKRMRSYTMVADDLRVDDCGEYQPLCHRCREWGHVLSGCNAVIQTKPEGTGEGMASAEELKGADGGEVVAFVKHSKEMEDQAKMLARTVRVRILQGQPSAADIAEELKKIFPIKLPCPLLDYYVLRARRFDYGSFLVYCHTDEHLKKLMETAYFRNDKMEAWFEMWSPSIGEWPADNGQSFWVNVFNFPLVCWGEEGFSDLMSSFAWVLEVGGATKFWQKADWATVKIQLFEGCKLPKEVITFYMGRRYKVTIRVNEPMVLPREWSSDDDDNAGNYQIWGLEEVDDYTINTSRGEASGFPEDSELNVGAHAEATHRRR